MKIDYAKRRRVMTRSQQLGHCICDPRRPCPCDVFRDDGICPCAGERPDLIDPTQVKLTALVHSAGCASKLPPGELDAMLARLPEVKDPAVVSGLAAGDDAAIYRIAPNLHLVQTVDVFTPCVDDPRLFGRICAVNWLSDIYAMGGEPRTALSILAFPSEKLPGEIMFEMLAGAMEIFAEAGVALIGGHSIKDEEVKLGFAITGLIDPAVAGALMRPAGGDMLVLTKPLGTGVLTFSQQIGRGHAAGLAAAQTSMATLNRAAAEAMREAGASACTDVTGFGLFGHLFRMVRAGGLTAQIWADALPAFPGAVEALRDGVVPGAIERNREYLGDAIRAAPGVDEARLLLGFDAQTSGGLLIGVAADRLAGLQQSLARRGVSGFVIGRIVARADGRIELTRSSEGAVAFPPEDRERTATEENFINKPGTLGQPRHVAGVVEDCGPAAKALATAAPASAVRPVSTGSPEAGSRQAKPAVTQAETSFRISEPKTMNSTDPNPASVHDGCCDDVFRDGTAPGTAAEAQKNFGAMMRAVQAGGALDEKTKELILFSLVLLSQCRGCFDVHYRRVHEMEITPAELDETAWCAIAMGGAPVRMFYQECLAHSRLSEQ